ncbi:MAG: hypothetical protein QM754_11315 [Tepidisphaeraceae bacterium]
MVRIYHIADPLLREKVLAKLAEWRGSTPAQIPEWFELDDGDYSELLIEIRADEERAFHHHDPD